MKAIERNTNNMINELKALNAKENTSIMRNYDFIDDLSDVSYAVFKRAYRKEIALTGGNTSQAKFVRKLIK